MADWFDCWTFRKSISANPLAPIKHFIIKKIKIGESLPFLARKIFSSQKQKSFVTIILCNRTEIVVQVGDCTVQVNVVQQKILYELFTLLSFM